MSLIADILLAAGALGAAFYCYVLGRRLRKFNDLENGMGGAVAVLSAQVDDLEKSLAAAQATAAGSTSELEALTHRAEDVRRQLELQIAALHDVVPEPTPQPAASDITHTAPPPETNEPMFVRHRAAGRTQ
ncbi:hypothetical protein E4Z66_17710 [Aliishimia ponticola]|uniref:Uncharacterized protein n=1 Tax=Aliishimia ponticola TaxID=2499833 RepID=A0A4S4N6V9_9RHOB|nr:DUF6468 domain-containing protein [Aliishimia ponticola]THH34799.1 hypothetical protein E4Z66_17710 [Aliishimia ponticola]